MVSVTPAWASGMKRDHGCTTCAAGCRQLSKSLLVTPSISATRLRLIFGSGG